MECSDYKELISVQLDGELNPVEEKQLNDHLALCTDCGKFQQELIILGQTMVATAKETMPQEIEQLVINKTVAKISFIKRIIGLSGGYYHMPRGVVWATAIILLFLIGNTIATHFNKSPRAMITQEYSAQSVMIQKVELTKADLVGVQTISPKVLRR
jgi:hypothetical protein